MHLIIEGMTIDPQRVHNLKFISELLKSYPAQIGMQRVSHPQVSQYQIPKSKQKVISGFVLLAESHVSLHFFPDQSFLSIDVFSCKEFDFERVIRDLQVRLDLREFKTQFFERPEAYLPLKGDQIDPAMVYGYKPVHESPRNGI